MTSSDPNQHPEAPIDDDDDLFVDDEDEERQFTDLRYGDPLPVPRRAVERADRPLGTPRVSTSSTSATLPRQLNEAVDAARVRGMTSTKLLEAAVEQPSPTRDDAADVLRRYDGEPRTRRSYHVRTGTLAVLDLFSSVWRMNRSQVITVLTTLELERLGRGA